MSLIGAQGGVIGAAGVAAGTDPTFEGLGTLFEGGESYLNSLSTTITDVAAGDLILVLVQRNMQYTCTGVSFGGSAMTLCKSANSGDINSFGADVWSILAPSSQSSVVITASYGAEYKQWGTISSARYRGASSATPLSSSCNSSGCSGLATSNTSRLAQSITTTERALLVACGTDYDLVQAHTAASGWTKRLDGSGTPFTTAQFLHDRVADAGTYGGATAFATTSSADTYLSILLAFPVA